MSRNDEIKRLRENEKWSMDKIGMFFGISKQRVHQIIGSTGNYFVSYHPEKARNFLSIDASKTTDEIKKETGKKPRWGGIRHRIDSGAAGKGHRTEEYVSKILKEKNINNTLTNSKPIDIVLDNGLFIEVKGRQKNDEDYYFFALARDLKKDKADFYILVIDDKECFVIPKDKIPPSGSVGITWPTPLGKWQKYHNMFSLLSND